MAWYIQPRSCKANTPIFVREERTLRRISNFTSLHIISDMATSRNYSTGNATGADIAMHDLAGSKTIPAVLDLRLPECA